MLWDPVCGQFLSKQCRVKVFERATMAVTGANTCADYFHAALWCVVDSFAFFTVIVTHIVSILLFKLFNQTFKLVVIAINSIRV